MYISIAFILFHTHITYQSFHKGMLMSQICKNKRISAIIRSTHRPRGPNFKGWNRNVNCFSYVRGRNAPFWCAAKKHSGVTDRGLFVGFYSAAIGRLTTELIEIWLKFKIKLRCFSLLHLMENTCVSPASGQHLSEAVQWSRPAIKVLQPSQVGCVRDS